jgi:sulfur relay (sulfurtransferase) complex TusBCD TusD component (DsrE family)
MNRAHPNITALFMDLVSEERLCWLTAAWKYVISENHGEIYVFLTGESLYSTIDDRTAKIWAQIPEIHLKRDAQENSLLGFLRSNDIPDFWDNLISTLQASTQPNIVTTFGILQLTGPYMFRTSVYSTRLLKTALNRGLDIEYYAYLDGIHTGHPQQNPSEFENIGQILQNLKVQAMKVQKQFEIYACSRCAKARGYIRTEEMNDFTVNEQVIPGFRMCNLNKIIDRCELNHPVLTANSLDIRYLAENNEIQKPEMFIFITHPPYSSEWTFGGLSFAVACANHEIETHVIFIEDGVFSVVGTPLIGEADKVFDTFELLIATEDIEELHFHAYRPSLNLRSVQLADQLSFISLVDESDLGKLMYRFTGNPHKRILFF